VDKGESLKDTVHTLSAYETLGCAVRYSLDGIEKADVIYALRMQNERMSGSFVPSLREYAARYQIDNRRLAPSQLLMHPGPVNRGVELAGEVVDSPQALIVQQVESGVVVRMAVLYELLAGGGGGTTGTRFSRTGAATEPQPA
jgi:aspartate carbamoyltransferase catalytic subunit